MPYYNAAVTKLKSALKGQKGLKAPPSFHFGATSRQNIACALSAIASGDGGRAGYCIPPKKSGLKARQKKVGGLLNKLMAATDKNGL